MTAPSPVIAARKVLSLATSIVESTGSPSSPHGQAAAVFDLVKLRPHVMTLMGSGGFGMLVARAKIMAGREIPWLAEITSKGDGTFAGFEHVCGRVSPDKIQTGHILLLSHLLSLLVKLIGPVMTLAVVRDAWPQAALDDIDPQKML